MIHKNGYFASQINFDSVSFIENGNGERIIDYGVLSVASDDESFSLKCIDNIRDLSYCVLGMNAFNFSSEFQICDPSIFDYSKLSKQDSSYVMRYYPVISEYILYGKDYFDDVIRGNYDYFNHYVDNLRINSSGRNTSMGSYVKTTPFGKGYGDRYNEETNRNAFVKIWFFPIIIGCMCFILFVSYMLLKYL